MGPLCYRRHRFPPEIIQHAIWLYLRFTLSYRDVEELLAERGLDISYETVRRWVLKFGPAIGATATPASPSAERSLAFGRDGGAHRRQADVSLAQSRLYNRGERGCLIKGIVVEVQRVRGPPLEAGNEALLQPDRLVHRPRR